MIKLFKNKKGESTDGWLAFLCFKACRSVRIYSMTQESQGSQLVPEDFTPRVPVSKRRRMKRASDYLGDTSQGISRGRISRVRSSGFVGDCLRCSEDVCGLFEWALPYENRTHSAFST